MADRNSIIEKIKSLLSKTTENGCTEEEALAALAKARAWIDTQWRQFSSVEDGPYDVSEEHETLDLTHASVVTGLRRNSRYTGE